MVNQSVGVMWSGSAGEEGSAELAGEWRSHWGVCLPPSPWGVGLRAGGRWDVAVDMPW